jgi:C-terminal processing protease CtpA/Prc
MVAEEEELDRQSNYGIGKVEVLPDGVGYLEIKGFASRSRGEQQAYAKAMTQLKDSRALVIDLRGNGGGDGDTVADLVGYLLDKKTLLQWDVERGGKQREHFSAEKVDGPRYGEKRPVYVLTSNRTFSAAEECAYDLQTQKRAVIVGEHTGGGANHNRFFRVANDFAVSVPYMTTKNAVTGKNWEGTGVLPDVAVPQADALDTARRLAAEKLASGK